MPSSLAGWLLLHFAIAAAGTWLARRYALSRQLLDHPDTRRSHVVPTPRGGGIAIVVSLLVALCSLMWQVPAAMPQLALVALGLSLVAGIGWIDDHAPLGPWSRLGVHALAAALLACIVAGASIANAVLGFACALVLVNVWNFMDGIDGIAASQALLAAVAYAVAIGSGPVAWLALALAAACAGFLPFNFPRARIFMGDVGSGALGYALASVIALSAGSTTGWLWLSLPLAAFLVDAALTLSTRIVQGERWWTPHVRHFYQRLARAWRGHQAVTLAFATWTTGSIVLMWWVHEAEATTIMCAVCAWYLAGAGIWIVTRRCDGMGRGVSE
jgi:UDP-N-acetylmuramyl pentapeptide phosphotransferase/UDP-N-acetylglucosamine-1-phosphate transferase